MRLLFQPIITFISRPHPATTTTPEGGEGCFRLLLRTAAGRGKKPHPHALNYCRDFAGGTPSPQRPRRGSGLTQQPTLGPGTTPTRAAFGVAPMPGADQEGGASPTAHFATQQAPSSTPGTHESWRDAQAAQHRYSHPLPSTTPHCCYCRSRLRRCPSPLPLMGPVWPLTSRRRADPAQSAGCAPLPPAPWVGSLRGGCRVSPRAWV